jgi:hypothetical protein
MTKKISKVIIYYEDGTYEEVKASVSDSQSKPNKETVSPSPVVPDFRPDTQKVQEWKPPNQINWPYPYQPYYAPYTAPNTGTPNWRPNDIWCTTAEGNVPLKYTVTSDSRNMEMPSWSFTSTGNADNLNKYTITSTGNGNVDLSK